MPARDIFIPPSPLQDSPLLQQDFRQLGEDFGYDYIELQLDFSMDLYPFFPPLVKVGDGDLF